MWLSVVDKMFIVKSIVNCVQCVIVMGNGCNRIDPACVRQMNDIHEAIAPICLLSTAMSESTVGKCCTFEWHFPSSKHL